MRLRVCPLMVSALFCALVALPAAAQSRTTLTLGYQALHLPDTWAAIGFNADVAVQRDNGWGWLGEFGVVHDGDDNTGPDAHDFNIFNVGGGARWSPSTSTRVHPFVQLLAGIQISTSDSDSDTAFMLQPGVGVHLPVSDRFGVSAQFDYRPAFYREDVVQEVRFVIGARVTLR